MSKIFFSVSIFVLLSINASNIVGSSGNVESEITSYANLMTTFYKEFEIYKKKKQIREDALYGESIYFLADIIENSLTEENRQKILNEILNHKEPKVSPKSVKGAIQAFLIYYSRQDNRNAVLNVLSKKCPSRIGIGPVEFFLTSETKLEDSFLLFFEAYRKSTDEGNKRVLALIIRRSLISKDDDDNSLIANAEKWYIENKSKLIVNEKYAFNNPLAHHIPLFIIKGEQRVPKENSN